MNSLFGFLNLKQDKLPPALITKHVRTYCVYLKAALLVKNPISLDNSQCSCAFRNSLFAG